MTDVVRRAEDIVVVSINLVSRLYGIAFGIVISMRACLVGSKLCIGHNFCASLVFHTIAIIIGDAVRIGLCDKQAFLRLAQHIPIPIADRIVLVVGLVVDNHLLAVSQFHVRSGVVGIEVGLHIQQLHPTM